MLFSVLTRKGKAPRHNSHTPKFQSWLRGGRAELAAPSGPGCHILPSCHLWGSQASNPNVPQSLQAAQMGRPGLTNCDPKRWPLLGGHRDRDRGEVHHLSRPGPRLVEGLSQGSGAPQDVVSSLFPGPPGSPTGPRLGEFQGLQRKAWICLLLSTWWAPHHWPLTESLSQLFLIDWYQWAGPTAILTKSWARQLMITHWQWVACGKVPLRHLNNGCARPVA